MVTRFSMLVLLCSLVWSVKAQGQEQINIMNAFHQYKPKASMDYQNLLFLVRNSLDKKVEGNPYLNEWQDALLVVEQDEIYSIRARYRIMDDEFQLQMNGQAKAIYPHLIEGIVFEDRVFLSGKELKSDGPIDGYYELLVAGDAELLKKHSSVQKVNKDDVIVLGSRNHELYFRNADGYLEKVETYARHLEKIFPNHYTEIQSYLKSNRIKANDEAKLRQLFTYYNNL